MIKFIFIHFRFQIFFLCVRFVCYLLSQSDNNCKKGKQTKKKIFFCIFPLLVFGLCFFAAGFHTFSIFFAISFQNGSAVYVVMWQLCLSKNFHFFFYIHCLLDDSFVKWGFPFAERSFSLNQTSFFSLPTEHDLPHTCSPTPQFQHNQFLCRLFVWNCNDWISNFCFFFYLCSFWCVKACCVWELTAKLTIFLKQIRNPCYSKKRGGCMQIK